MSEGRTASVRLEGSQIVDWDTFHTICAKEFGFPDFYGRNSDAWIDCLSYVDTGEGMTRFAIGPTGFLDIELTEAAGLGQRCPNILVELASLIAFVNQRFIESGDRPPLRLILP